jgi:hypothetical protein
MKKSLLWYLLIHVYKVNFSFSPIVEILKYQQLLEEIVAFLLVDLVLQKSYSHGENQVEKWRA